MACYEQFHWGDEQIDRILQRGMEAERLSIYFEEIGAYQHKKNKELKDRPNTSSGGGGSGETVVVDEMPSEDYYNDDYSAYLEEED